MPSTVTTGRISYACPCRMGKWLGRAVSPNVAHSPGQRPGWGVRRDLYIWHFGGSAAKMPRAPWRVTSLIMPPRGVYPFVCYALLARGIFVGKNAECIVACSFFPGRCPGLLATIGLSARLNTYIFKAYAYTTTINSRLYIYYCAKLRICTERKACRLRKVGLFL